MFTTHKYLIFIPVRYVPIKQRGRRWPFLSLLLRASTTSSRLYPDGYGVILFPLLLIKRPKHFAPANTGWWAVSLSLSTSETNRKIIAGIAVVSLFPFGGDEDLGQICASPWQRRQMTRRKSCDIILVFYTVDYHGPFAFQIISSERRQRARSIHPPPKGINGSV